MQKKWPFINKPAVQNVEQPKPEAPKVQQQPASEQKPAQMPNPNVTAPMTQQKPMQMPAQMPNPNAMAPMTQQNTGYMPLPTVPAPKDNSMGPVKSLKMEHKMMNPNIMGQQVMEQPMKKEPFMQQPMKKEPFMQQHMDDHNKMDQYMKDQHLLGQKMKDEDLMEQYMKGQNMPEEYMKPQNISGYKMKGEDMMEPMMDQFMKNDYMTGQHMQDYMDQEEAQTSMVEALRLIKEAVEGEAEDRMFYDFLIRNARSEKDREIIMGIRDDEIRHAKMFRQLYYELTGRHIGPATNVNFERPKSYCDGLIKALMGEQNAVRKYRRILFAMKERKHINTLTEIITDEIRHAALYNLLINNNECRY